MDLVHAPLLLFQVSGYKSVFQRKGTASPEGKRGEELECEHRGIPGLIFHGFRVSSDT